MMNRRWKRLPPYEGQEPYVYFAFAEADSPRAEKLLVILWERGCRVWYCCGLPGSGEELLHRQQRAAGASLTLLLLTDAACADKDTKSFVLVNQKHGRPILCLDPDGADRRLSMGLRESVPHIELRRLKGREEIESAILHAEGFSQTMLGEAVKIGRGGAVRWLTAALWALAALCVLAGALLLRGRSAPSAVDEVSFSDPVIESAVRDAARGGPITLAVTESITELRLSGEPESWEELSLLPALETIELPQSVLTSDAALPEGGYTITLSGGGA